MISAGDNAIPPDVPGGAVVPVLVDVVDDVLDVLDVLDVEDVVPGPPGHELKYVQTSAPFKYQFPPPLPTVA